MEIKRKKVNWRWIKRIYREFGEYKIVPQSDGSYIIWLVSNGKKPMWRADKITYSFNKTKECCEENIHYYRYAEFLEFKKWFKQHSTYKKRQKAAIYIPPKKKISLFQLLVKDIFEIIWG